MTLQIKEGSWYRRRDGEEVGPVESSTAYGYPFSVGPLSYNGAGKCWNSGIEVGFDLIEEIPNPKESDVEALKLTEGAIYKLRNGTILPPMEPNQGDDTHPWAASRFIFTPTGACFSRSRQSPYDIIELIAPARETNNGDGTTTKVCTIPVTMRNEAWETHDVAGVRTMRRGDKSIMAGTRPVEITYQCDPHIRLILIPKTPAVDPYWPKLADAIDAGDVEIPSRYKKIYYHNGNWPCICLEGDGPSYQWHQSLGNLPIRNDDTPFTIDLTAFRAWHAERGDV